MSVLLWCALAALLVTALFLLVRDATGRPGLAAALAFGFALVPPFLFYFFQFYPEMVGALVLAVAFRTLALRPEGLPAAPLALRRDARARCPGCTRSSCRSGSCSWPRRCGSAARRDRDGAAGSGAAPSLAVGLARADGRSLYLTALYNFAITGSVRPDALFLAWGPGGRDERARRPGRPRPAARRAVRHPALRAGPAARGRRASSSAARGASPWCCRRPPSTT